MYVANCSDRTKQTVLSIIFNLYSPLDLALYGGFFVDFGGLLLIIFILYFLWNSMILTGLY